MDEVKKIEAIFCTKKRRGLGITELDPVRIVTEIFDLDGNLLAENDSEIIYTAQDMLHFAHYCIGSKIEPAILLERFKSQKKDVK